MRPRVRRAYRPESEFLWILACAALLAGCAARSSPATTKPARETAEKAGPGSSGRPDFRWKGVELFGRRDISREAILKDMPVEMGAPVDMQATNAVLQALTSWCRDLKEQHALAFAECSFVAYADGRVYLTVDLVHPDEAYRLAYRPRPAGSAAVSEPGVFELLGKLQSLTHQMLIDGRPASEIWAGFLDYREPAPHEMAVELSKRVPPLADELLEVLDGERDDRKRGQAAWLLYYSGNPPRAIREAAAHLDDPSSLVRNNLSRYLINVVGEIPDAQVRRSVVDALLVQLGRPSMSDRNKSLFALLELARAHEDTRRYIAEKGEPLIASVRDTSILANVRGPAEELLDLLEP
ncbi:MAG: hypothetical protein JXR96_22205 [Deltaproteobacteria bacterium]|nr:hypothetical protein [Deltaproteobacteria bacterium]